MAHLVGLFISLCLAPESRNFQGGSLQILGKKKPHRGVLFLIGYPTGTRLLYLDNLKAKRTYLVQKVDNF